MWGIKNDSDIKRMYFRWKNSVFDKTNSYGFTRGWWQIRKNGNKE